MRQKIAMFLHMIHLALAFMSVVMTDFSSDDACISDVVDDDSLNLHVDTCTDIRMMMCGCHQSLMCVVLLMRLYSY